MQRGGITTCIYMYIIVYYIHVIYIYMYITLFIVDPEDVRHQITKSMHEMRLQPSLWI